jgi:hypothetical protein
VKIVKIGLAVQTMMTVQTMKAVQTMNCRHCLRVAEAETQAGQT